MSVFEEIPDRTARRLLVHYFDRVNAGMVEDLLELFAEDAVVTASSGETSQGRSAIGAYYRTTLGRFAEHHDEPRRVHVAATAIIVELHFEGRLHRGPHLSFDALDVFELAAPGIERIDLWADTAAINRQARQDRASP